MREKMDKKSTFSYILLAAGIAAVMLLTFGISGRRTDVSIVLADENDATQTDATEAGGDNTEEGSTEDSSEKSTEETTGGTTSSELSTETTSTISAEEIARLTSEYNDTMKEKNSLQEKLNSIADSQNDFISTLNDLDDLIIEYQDKIDELQEGVTKATDTQTELMQQVEEAQMVQDAQYALFKAHIQEEYENGAYTYLDIIFNSEEYIDIVNRAEYIAAIDDYDERVLEEYKTQKRAIADKQALVTSLIADKEKLQQAYLDEQESLQVIADEKVRQINSYQNNIDELQSEIDSLEADMNSYISQIEASYNVTFTTTESGISIKYTGEDFIWPMPTSYSISSYYGKRVAPTAGATTDHKGIDISCSMGSEVVAAAAGTVIYTGYLGNGGNCVIVDHGSGISTCYFHLSSFKCEEGDSVTAGQVICLSGNTGVSTGPHLHFAVRENGQYVNPLKYFPNIEDKSTVSNTEGD